MLDSCDVEVTATNMIPLQSYHQLLVNYNIMPYEKTTATNLDFSYSFQAKNNLYLTYREGNVLLPSLFLIV